MKNAMERLNEIVTDKGPLLAGLDPDLQAIQKLYTTIGVPKEIYPDIQREAVSDYCLNYIHAIKKVVGAIKINIAFFEAHHMEDTFFDVAQNAKENGLFVIGDVKRADIGNISRQYAEAYLYKESPLDAVTINPYFGFDSVKPFLDMAKENDKGIFILVKTSNPSSSEIQDLVLENGKRVYEKVAELVKKWGEYIETEKTKYNLVGAVIGITSKDETKKLRKLLPNTFFLVPGYGSQGKAATDVVVNFDECGGGAIVNYSRGIMNAWENNMWNEVYEPKKWTKSSKAEAQRAKSEIYVELQKHIKLFK